ncbi:hypothetical protein BH11MYX4_BH11MYX4_12120 [soil metagenome]
MSASTPLRLEKVSGDRPASLRVVDRALTGAVGGGVPETAPRVSAAALERWRAARRAASAADGERLAHGSSGLTVFAHGTIARVIARRRWRRLTRVDLPGASRRSQKRQRTRGRPAGSRRPHHRQSRGDRSAQHGKHLPRRRSLRHRPRQARCRAKGTRPPQARPDLTQSVSLQLPGPRATAGSGSRQRARPARHRASAVRRRRGTSHRRAVRRRMVRRTRPPRPKSSPGRAWCHAGHRGGR